MGNKNDYIDVRELLRKYCSKWHYFLASIVLCCLLGIIYCRLFPSDYAVRANVLIQQEEISPLGNMGGLGQLFGASAYVDDEIFVISSHSLYKEVAEKLQINKTHYVSDGFLSSHLAYPEFPIDVVAPNIADTLRTVVAFKIKVDQNGLADIKAKAKHHTVAELEDVKLPAVVNTIYGDFTIVTTPNYIAGEELKSRVLFTGYDKAAERLDEEISVDLPSRKSNVISLAYDVQNPDLGKAVLDEVILLYNQRGINEKNQQAQKTAQFLEDRIALLAQDLNIAESNIQKYKENNKIIDVAAEAAFQTEKKESLEAELLTAEIELEIINMTHKFLTDSVTSYSMVPLTSSNSEIAEEINAYNELVVRRENLLRSAKSGNYALHQLNKQIDLLRGNILSTLVRENERSKIHLSEMKKVLSGAESKLNKIPTQEREYINMKRQQEVKQQLYLFLLQRQEETSIILANSIPKGQVVDKAYTLSDPIGLSNKWILVICFFLGLCIPPICLYFYQLLRDKVESRSDVENNLSVPILGEMCVDKSGNKLFVTERDNSSSGELMRLLRTNLQFMLRHTDDKIVLVTSTQSGEGKSFIAINLAASLSLQHGSKVIVVGMDIRKPKLGNYIGVNESVGVTTFLASANCQIDSIIQHVDGFENLDAIAAGPIPPNPAELLLSNKIEVLFGTLRMKYDYIIIDSAPIGMVSDTFSLNRIADATVYVTRLNHTRLSDLKYIKKICEDKRLKNISIVINGTKSKRGYGYGY